MPKKKKTAKKGNPTARTNRVYALILAVSGVLFVAIPNRIAEVLPYYLFALMLLHALLMFYRGTKAGKRARTGYLLDAAVSFVLCVLFVVFRERSADPAADLGRGRRLRHRRDGADHEYPRQRLQREQRKRRAEPEQFRQRLISPRTKGRLPKQAPFRFLADDCKKRGSVVHYG